MLADLRRHGVNCHSVDLTQKLRLTASEPHTPDIVAGHDLPPLPRIIHLNPPHFARGLEQLGASAFAAPVVAYWAWELEQAPREWAASIALADEIWVPSAFVRDAINRTFDLGLGMPQVRVVPHAVAAGEPLPRAMNSRVSARKKLGLSQNNFVAGFSFSMLAGVERKNPKDAIAAFKLAFPNEKHPRLLLRCVDAKKNRAMWSELQLLARGDTRVKLLDSEHLGMQDFYAVIDVLLSLQRSEGYGLTLAEALHAGIPVISTAWSLGEEIVHNVKFLAVTSELVPVIDPQGPYKDFRSQRWASPDVSIAAHHLRDLSRLEGYAPRDIASDEMTS